MQKWQKQDLELINLITLNQATADPTKFRILLEKILKELEEPIRSCRHYQAWTKLPGSNELSHQITQLYQVNIKSVDFRLSEKQKFGLRLLLLRGGVKSSEVTSGYRTVLKQIFLMVKNYLMVSHPDWPTTGTWATEREKKVLSNYAGGVFKHLVSWILENFSAIDIQFDPQKPDLVEVASLGPNTHAPGQAWTVKEIKDWAQGKATEFMEKVDANTQKQPTLDALAEQQKNWPAFQAILDKAETKAKRKALMKGPHPSAPSSHVSGNVIDLVLISPAGKSASFDQALVWGKENAIIEYVIWEGSHYHLVFY